MCANEQTMTELDDMYDVTRAQLSLGLADRSTQYGQLKKQVAEYRYTLQ